MTTRSIALQTARPPGERLDMPAQVQTLPVPPTRRQAHLDGIRAFAILNIVAIHVVGVTMYMGSGTQPLPDYTATRILAEVLFHSSTAYFTLISGFLYSVVLSRQPLARYWRGRVHNIVAPYLFMTVGLMLIKQPPWPLGIGGLTSWAGAVAGSFLTGSAYYHLWYMPVAICLFAMGPGLYRLGARERLGWLLPALALMPLVSSRQGIAVGGQTFLYFTGIYAAGLWFGIDHERKLKRLRRHRALLAATAIGSSLLLLRLYHLQIEPWGPVSPIESMHFIQRLSITGLLLLWMRDHQIGSGRLAGELARASFAIYFLHAPVIGLLDRAWLAAAPPPATLVGGLLMMLGTWGATLGLSLLAARVLRRLLGDRSRLLIGA